MAVARGELTGSALVDALLAADPWCAPFTVDIRRALAAEAGSARSLAHLAGRSELASRRHSASAERMARGIDAWNDWAFQLLKLRHDLREAPTGLQVLDVLAAVDFSGTVFDGMTDLGAWHFPGDAIFRGARFRRDLWLADAKLHGRADFNGAELEGTLWCEFARFSGHADFSDALFAKTVELRDSRLLGGASFARATFLDAWFRGAEWRGPVTFAGARFSGEAGFGASTWYGDVDFSDVTFGDNAGFDNSTFAGVVSFAGARFSRRARFDGTRFASRPTFDRVRFATPPTPADVLAAPEGSPVHDQIAQIRQRLGVG